MFSILPKKDINDFVQLETFCNIHYKYLSSGTSRKVYDLNNEYVIKIAFNIYGIYQNQSEVRLCKQYYDSDLILPIVEYSNLWVIQKKVLPITKETSILFKELYDVSFEKICLLIKCVCQHLKQHKIKYYYENINEFAHSIEKFLVSTNTLFFIDYCKYDSWGYLNGKIYIIDYGMDNETYSKYIRNG